MTGVKYHTVSPDWARSLRFKMPQPKFANARRCAGYDLKRSIFIERNLDLVEIPIAPAVSPALGVAPPSDLRGISGGGRGTGH